MSFIHEPLFSSSLNSIIFFVSIVFSFFSLAFIGILYAHRKNKKRKSRGQISPIEDQIHSLNQEVRFYEDRKKELHKRSQQRHLLSRAARELGASLNPIDIQKKLIDTAKIVFNGQNAVITYGDSNDPIDHFILQRRQPVLVPSDVFKGDPLMAVPITVQRSIAGVLRVFGASAQFPYSRDDMRLLDSLASLASLAMDNSMLFNQIEQSALRDGLTGLLTHKAFQDQLDESILEASRYNQPLSIILCDVDHFKKVNDTHGHQAGDLVLQGFAHVLDRNVRDVDIVARYGGEEFILLLRHTSHAQAKQLAEKIRIDLMAQEFDTGSQVLSITSSFGVATFPEDATSGQQLIRQADQRLYKCKEGGRNQVRGRNG
ncbi:MAG: GGDEF domain-containing protein [Elusimicrobiota bacterium]